MKNIDELPDLMIKIIEGAKELSNGEIEFTEEAVDVVREIAEYARKTRIYQDSLEMADGFWDEHEKTVRAVWLHMLDRVVHAPTSLHRDGSVLILMPVLDDLMQGSI